jgi:hypothetical protein
MTGEPRLSRRGWLALGSGGLAALLGLTAAPLPAAGPPASGPPTGGSRASSPPASGSRASSPEEGLEAGGDRLERLPRGRWPRFAAEPETARLYRFAVERPDVLRHFPCFCGCGRAGHRNNRDCYVQAEHADGTLTFTSHAAT